MPTTISPLAHVDKQAQIGENVTIGPFCSIGPNVILGDECQLDSHVCLTGYTTIGKRNHFWPGSVIGAEPQDFAYTEGAPTEVIIGDGNQFREGVTINRGAEKEDGVTRVGNETLMMANAHVAHNCNIGDKAILVNGVLLGGHVHVGERAIVSGNTVVHHFTSVGTLSLTTGGARITTDVLPYVMAAGNDDFRMRTINIVGMRRAGIEDSVIKVVRAAFKLIVREHKPLNFVKAHFEKECQGVFPIELATMLQAWEAQKGGRMGRAREAVRDVPYTGGKRAA